MKLLFVLAVTNEDSAAAEKFLDFVRTTSGKKGHLLLAFMSDVHDEMRERIRISAELAFEAVHPLVVLPLSDRAAVEITKTNNMIRQVAKEIANGFAWPFVWLNGDCTPTCPTWREDLAAAYYAQPKPYMGNRMLMKIKSPEPKDLFFMATVGIYPVTAHTLMLSQADSVVPIEIESASLVIGKLGITKIIQYANLKSEGDLLSIRDEAVLVTGDKLGLLRAQVAAAKPSRYALLEEVQMPDPLIKRLAQSLTNGVHR